MTWDTVNVLAIPQAREIAGTLAGKILNVLGMDQVGIVMIFTVFPLFPLFLVPNDHVQLMTYFFLFLYLILSSIFFLYLISQVI